VTRDSGGKQLPFVIQTAVEDLVFTPARPADGGRPVSQAPAIQTPPFLPTSTPAADRKPGDQAINPKDKLIYVWVPPGTFQMGCSTGDNECEGNERPAHQVTISKGFWMGQTEVTEDAYQKLTGKDPSTIKGAKLPVDGVTWEDARNYCQAAGMRLPTEAEWELAARAGGGAGRYGDLDRIAWYRGNSGGQKREVGLKQANAWGLYDTLGNLWEWVADWYTDRYSPVNATDPQGPASGKAHTVRGGSCNVIPLYARVSYRDRSEPTLNSIGFRCVGN
jgi:formylglycine-generating enzyme required for sulfatase activity